ncbi:MAG: hypothetical protein R3E48_16675 [Burkholderiaceae bacterium]
MPAASAEGDRIDPEDPGGAWLAPGAGFQPRLDDEPDRRLCFRDIQIQVLEDQAQGSGADLRRHIALAQPGDEQACHPLGRRLAPVRELEVGACRTFPAEGQRA